MPVKLENIHQVVVLTVDVSANGNLFQFFEGNVHKSLFFLEDLSCPLDYHGDVFFVELLLIAEVVHTVDNPFRSDIVCGVQLGANVA